MRSFALSKSFSCWKVFEASTKGTMITSYLKLLWLFVRYLTVEQQFTISKSIVKIRNLKCMSKNNFSLRA